MRNEKKTDKGEIQKIIGCIVNLLETINHAALGTCMANRKNVPAIGTKLHKGQSEFRCTDSGLLCVKWQDTKEVLLMSNCHKPEVTRIGKKNKTGVQEEIDCPQAIAFYRQKMGGVDRSRSIHRII
ncbi:hypothetical protein NQ317_019594 [Molorchus minor]|uniref:PiggyBac transposable element-derived protein domain-containing protein n=1 Tax=Molorchus minor TaxID=1323400 RepID=A0ABQ9J5U4_9CUCU|nr:hypothetical protein NQ317_019594 [Molorchus minor]